MDIGSVFYPNTAGRDPVCVLAVLHNEQERTQLTRILRHSTWIVHAVSCFEQAAGILHTSPVGVVIAQYNTCGLLSWRDLLEATRRLLPAPRVVVTDQLADQAIWAEALNLGAHDFLVQPFDPQEVFHVLACAWLSWKNEKNLRRKGVAARTSCA